MRERLPYIRELGLSYLHLMPLLRSRAGENDGGYAVADYRAVEPALGTTDDLRRLSAALHDEGMTLCIDLVINHTAREHDWAQRATAGDAAFRDFYLTYPDRTKPDAFERTLPLVFPDFKPSNFTWSEALGRWVWTTFNEWQWDLDYANPAVFAAMLENLLFLANAGVDVLRLDAVPFMWKRLGTNCQNQPEVHELLQAYRAIVRVVAPAMAFKAEAIVSPHDLVGYLGTGRHAGRECDLAYHNSLMVLLWSTLATRRVDLMTRTLRRDARRADRLDLDHLRALPRRHRLGDHRGQRGRRRGGRSRAPQVPGPLLPGPLLGVVRARRGVPARVQRRGADERDRSVAGRAGGGARGRRRAGRRPRRAPDPAAVRRGVLLWRHPARVHGR